jgi:hypothetical protein
MRLPVVQWGMGLRREAFGAKALPSINYGDHYSSGPLLLARIYNAWRSKIERHIQLDFNL